MLPSNCQQQIVCVVSPSKATLVNIQTFYCDVARLRNVILGFIIAKIWLLSCCTPAFLILQLQPTLHHSSSSISSSSLFISSTIPMSPLISSLTGLLMFLSPQKMFHDYCMEVQKNIRNGPKILTRYNTYQHDDGREVSKYFLNAH